AANIFIERAMVNIHESVDSGISKEEIDDIDIAVHKLSHIRASKTKIRRLEFGKHYVLIILIKVAVGCNEIFTTYINLPSDHDFNSKKESHVYACKHFSR